MSSSVTAYVLTPRKGLGSTSATRERTAGQVPVTINRPGQPSQHLAIDNAAAEHLVRNVIHLCDVQVEGKPISVLKGEVQRHCIHDTLQHIDLKQVDANGEVVVEVAIIMDAATSAGVKAGGIAEYRHRSVPLRCPAKAIPASIIADVTELGIQQTLTADKLKLPKGVSLACKADYPIVTVVIPRTMKKAEEEAAAAAAAAGPVAAAAAPAAGKAPAAGAAAPAAGKDAAKKDEPKKK